MARAGAGELVLDLSQANFGEKVLNPSPHPYQMFYHHKIYFMQ